MEHSSGNLQGKQIKTATVKAFEARFSKESAKNPIETPTINTEIFEYHVVPEFIDRAKALYRFTYEAREGRGEDDLRYPDLDQERIMTIYDHGPAGYKPQPQKEIPGGYAERKAACDMANLKWQG